jgi:hypothetical protein
MWMSSFNHQATIQLFDYALHDRSQWQSNDAAVRQIFGPKPKRPLQVTKTEWRTTLFCSPRSDIGSRKIGDMSDEGSVGSGHDMDGYHMITVETCLKTDYSCEVGVGGSNNINAQDATPDGSHPSSHG